MAVQDRSIDRFAGCLLAQALGDALGFVVEGERHAVCAPYLERWRAAGFALVERRPPFAPGQYSDDTQLARELVASLVEAGGFDPAHYAGRIARLFAQGAVVGHGPSTEAAARRLALGVPWHAAGTPGPVAGNGGAMRVAPLALLLAGRPDTLHAAAGEQARITHADPRCAAGARVVARAVVASLHDEAPDAALCDELARWADPDAALAGALRTLPQWLAAAPMDALPVLGSAGLAAGEGRHGIAPHVTPSVVWAVYAALKHPADLPAALATAVVAGGDVDTTAAMAGAIVGARVGLAALPPASQAVHDRGAHGFDDLRQLAHALARRAEATGGIRRSARRGA